MAGNWSVSGRVMGGDAHHELNRNGFSITSFFAFTKRRQRTHLLPKGVTKRSGFWRTIPSVSAISCTDIFGARFSETLIRDGNSLRFTFEYPDGPFHTTFRWFPESGTWQWLMEQKNKEGKWTNFAGFKVAHSSR
jgi:hypothetical protein